MISPPTDFPALRAVGGSSPDNKGLKSCQENRPLDNFHPLLLPRIKISRDGKRPGKNTGREEKTMKSNRTELGMDELETVSGGIVYPAKPDDDDHEDPGNSGGGATGGW